MIFHWIITPFVVFLTALFNALPPWTVDLGSSWLHYSLQWLRPLDKFIPLHDAVLPLLAILLACFVGLNAVKWFKWLLSLIPTISSAG